MVQDLIKEYLVSLNLQVNNSQFSTFTGKIKELDRLAEGVTNKTARSISLAVIGITSFLASVTGGVAAFLDGLAQSDIETEKFARRMWMTEENARSLQITLNAMGQDLSDLQDIAMNPELMGYFNQLRNEAAQLLPPAELQDKLQGVRQIRFEFMRLRMMVSYGAQWVGYYLLKYLEEPMARIKTVLQEANINIKQALPRIAERVAYVLANIVKITFKLAENIAKAASSLRDFWNGLSQGEQTATKFVGILAAIGGLLFKFRKNPLISGTAGLLLKIVKIASPLGRVVALVGMLIAAFDTVKGMTSGESSFSKIFGDKAVVVALKGAAESVVGVFEQLYEIYLKIDDAFKKATGFGIFEFFLQTFKTLLIDVLNFINGVASGIEWILSGLNKLVDFIGGTSNNFMSGSQTRTSIPVYNPSSFTPAYAGANNVRSGFNGNMNVTQNIYGSDPNATAKESNRLTRIMLNRQLT